MHLSIKRFSKALGFIIFSILILYVISIGLSLISTNQRDNHDPNKQAEMLKISLEVCDLAPIPKTAKIETIETLGNMFSRNYRIVFGVDNSTIDKWLADSNGIKTAEVEKQGNVVKYHIKPREGYQVAEVVVDYSSHTVTINVEWS